MRRQTRILLIVLVTFGVIGCGATNPERRSPDSGNTRLEDTVTAEDRAAVITEVARHRILIDNSFGGGHRSEKIAIVDRLGTETADGFIRFNKASRRLTPSEKNAIEDQLPSNTIDWVTPKRANAIAESVLDAMENNEEHSIRVVVRLAAPDINGDVATMTSTLFCGGLCGVGGGHQIERQSDGSWQVTEEVGPQWIS